MFITKNAKNTLKYNDYFSDNFRGDDFKCFCLYALLYIYIFSILILYDISTIYHIYAFM